MRKVQELKSLRNCIRELSRKRNIQFADVNTNLLCISLGEMPHVVWEHGEVVRNSVVLTKAYYDWQTDTCNHKVGVYRSLHTGGVRT